MSLRQQLKGTGVALVTPFTKNSTVDYNAFGKLIDFIINDGVNYVVVLGTTGETPTLAFQEKIDIIHYTYEKVAGRVPVVVGIGGNNTQAVINDVESYPLQKATAILSASPHYNKPTQQGIYEHYKLIAQASPKPVIIYNVPARTGSNIAADTTLRLAKEIKNIAGIKEASGNIVQCMHILQHRPEAFLVTSGEDHLTLPLITCGMDGVISVAANCFPKTFSQMVTLCLQGKFDIAQTLHYKLLQGFDLLFAENNPAGVKAFLAELNIIENYVRLPLLPVSQALYTQVKAYLKTYNI